MGAFRTPLRITAVALFGGTLASLLLRRSYKPHAANLWLAAGNLRLPPRRSPRPADLLPRPHLQTTRRSHRPRTQAGRPHRHPRRVRVRPAPSASTSTAMTSTSSTAAAPTSGTAASSPTPHPSSKTTSRSASSGPRRAASSSGPRPEHVPALPGKTYFIAQSGGKEIISNQPNPY